MKAIRDCGILLTALVVSSCGNGTEPRLRNAHLTFLTPPGTAEGQAPFDPPVRVAIEDANGNIIATADTDVSIFLVAQPTWPAGQPPIALYGTTLVRTVMGVATFDSLSVSLPGDGYQLQASMGTLTVTSTPFSVRLTFTASSAGDFHSCGLTIAHFAYCWGLNGINQIGDSTNVARYIPSPAKGRVLLRQLSAGGSHVCGIGLDSIAYCWGGLPPGSPSATPAPLLAPTAMAGLSGMAQLSAGLVGQFSRTCGVTGAGVTYCWGNYDTPASVPGAPPFRQVSTGSGHVCGLTADSAAYCWGSNDRGQLGDSSQNDRATPVPVAGGHRFRQVAAGGEHTCGITTDGSAYCWGDNAFGTLGDSTTDQRLVPTRVSGTLVFKQLSAGGVFTCGVTTTGVGYCWGYNGSAQLGDSSSTSRTTPTPVRGGHIFSEISTGISHTCGLATDGVYCWGMGGGGGLLGDGSSGSSLVPRRVVQ